MSLVHNDRVRETSGSIGTGTFALAGAQFGYQSFSAGIGVGNQCYYTIVNSDGAWETGVGTLTSAAVFTRNQVFASSNANTLVNFGNGTKDIFNALPASIVSSLSNSVAALQKSTTLSVPGLVAAWTTISSGMTFGSGLNVVSMTDFIGGATFAAQKTFGGATVAFSSPDAAVQFINGGAFAYNGVLPSGTQSTLCITFRIDLNGNNGLWGFGDGTAYHTMYPNGSANTWSFDDGAGSHINVFGGPSGWNSLLYENNNGAITISLLTAGAWSQVASGSAQAHMGGNLWINGFGAGNFGANNLSFRNFAYITGGMLDVNSRNSVLPAWLANPIGPSIVTALNTSADGSITVTTNNPTEQMSMQDLSVNFPSVSVPFAGSLPGTQKFSPTTNTNIIADTYPKMSAALRAYGHLALDISNKIGKADKPPGYDQFTTYVYPVSNTVIIPKSGTLEGRNSGIVMVDAGFQTFTDPNYPTSSCSTTIWAIWSDGAQQYNTQKIWGIRASGAGDGNASVHSCAFVFDQCNRLEAYDLQANHASEGFVIVNPQYGDMRALHAGNCEISFSLQSWGGFNTAAGELDITEWGRFYAWSYNDVSSNVSGIGLLQVHDSGPQVRPFRIRGFWSRSHTTAIALCRNPGVRTNFGYTRVYGITLDIDGGSTEYNWGGQGGENELNLNYSVTGMNDGSGSSLATSVGPLWYTVPGIPNTASGTFTWTATLPGWLAINAGATITSWTVNGASVYNDYVIFNSVYPAISDIPLMAGDVMVITWSAGPPVLQVLSHSYRSKVPITQIRGGLVYLDYGTGLQLDNYAMNNNKAQILFHMEESSIVRIHRLVWGGAGIYGSRARGPNARVEFMQGLPMGFKRAIWENIAVRPRFLDQYGIWGHNDEFISTQQQSTVLCSFGVPNYKAAWNLPLQNDTIPITLPGSGGTWTNSTGFRIRVNSTSSFTFLLNGSVIGNNTSFYMEPNDILTLTYSGTPALTFSRPTGCLYSPINALNGAIPNRSSGMFFTANTNIDTANVVETNLLSSSSYPETFNAQSTWGIRNNTPMVQQLTFHPNVAHAYKAETDFVYTPYLAGGATCTVFSDMTGTGTVVVPTEAGQLWQIAQCWFKLVGPASLASVRIQPHLRSTGPGGGTGPGYWYAGCSPMRNLRPRTIAVGASGTAIRNPFAFAVSQYDTYNENYGNSKTPTFWGYGPSNAEVVFNGFTGLQVNSTNPGVWGPPPLQGGGVAGIGPYILGNNDQGGQDEARLTPDDQLVYTYSGTSSPSITVKAALPEGVTLWQGRWQCVQIIWNDNQDAQFAISLVDVPGADVTILSTGLAYYRMRNQDRQSFDDCLYEAPWF